MSKRKKTKGTTKPTNQRRRLLYKRRRKARV